MTQKQALFNKYNALLKLITALRPTYLDATEDEKSFMQTVVGAAIFYLPKRTRELWDGKISKQALADHHPDFGIKNPKLSEDHIYPRKDSAKELLENDWSEKTVDDLINCYCRKLGKFTYVTQRENKELIKYQKKASSHSEASKLAGLIFFKISYEELSLIKKRDRKTIEKILKLDDD